jgi:hypothetical protein
MGRDKRVARDLAHVKGCPAFAAPGPPRPCARQAGPLVTSDRDTSDGTD